MSVFKNGEAIPSYKVIYISKYIAASHVYVVAALLKSDDKVLVKNEIDILL